MKIHRQLTILPIKFLALVSIYSPPAHAASILFVGGPAAASPTDTNVIARLTGFGNTVTYVSAPASTTAGAMGQNVIFISSTVASADVTNKFAGINIGIFNWEQAIQQQSRMNLLTEAAERNNDGAFTQLTITAAGAGSPLAAGLAAGTYSVTNAVGPYGYGNAAGFGAGATGVAVRGDGLAAETTRFGIYGYETGSLRPDNTPSPGRRVNFFLNDTSFDTLTATGLQLFDAGAKYVGAAVPEPSISALAGIALAAAGGFRKRRAGT